MKTYIITLSQYFLKGHVKAGECTYFKEKFLKGSKIHTIRGNYPLWEKRIAEVERGEACLSIREWTGKPRRSKQVEIARLTKENGVGIQKMELTNDLSECIIGGRHYNYVDIARNDGLDPADWLDWFNIYDLFKPLAIIHFTPFRYR